MILILSMFRRKFGASSAWVQGIFVLGTLNERTPGTIKKSLSFINWQWSWNTIIRTARNCECYKQLATRAVCGCNEMNFIFYAMHFKMQPAFFLTACLPAWPPRLTHLTRKPSITRRLPHDSRYRSTMNYLS